MSNYSIESLSQDNIENYAEVNILAWEQTYKGIISDEFIELFCSKTGKENIIEKLKRELYEKDKKSFLLKVNNEYVGILKIRKSKYEEYSDYGELGAIYLLDRVKGKGYGKILFNKAVIELRNMGYNKMFNSCYEGNLANGFYKHMNGKLVESREFILSNGEKLIENIYVYDI